MAAAAKTAAKILEELTGDSTKFLKTAARYGKNEVAEAALKSGKQDAINATAKQLSGDYKDNVKRSLVDEFAKPMWEGIAETFTTAEGWERVAGNVATGAAWGAGIGGVTEAARGGSFWEGAKGGALSGATYGAVGAGLGGGARKLPGWDASDAAPGGMRNSYNSISKQLSTLNDHNSLIKLSNKIYSA